MVKLTKKPYVFFSTVFLFANIYSLFSKYLYVSVFAECRRLCHMIQTGFNSKPPMEEVAGSKLIFLHRRLNGQSGYYHIFYGRTLSC